MRGKVSHAVYSYIGNTMFDCDKIACKRNKTVNTCNLYICLIVVFIKPNGYSNSEQCLSWDTRDDLRKRNIEHVGVYVDCTNTS